MKNLYYYASLILFLWVMGGSLALFYYQYIDGMWNPPLTFQMDAMNLKTDKMAYRPGDTISVQSSACKNRNYSAHTTWKLVDDVVITFPEQGVRIVNIGCVKDRWFQIGKIPMFASKGANHLEGVSLIQVNPLRTIYINYRSQDFMVL